MDVEEGTQNENADRQQSISPPEVHRNLKVPLLYSVNDQPPWGLSFLLGLQHYLTTVGGIIAVPFILCPALCILQDDPSRSYLISTIFMVSGIATSVQLFLGIRLPIIQGSSFTFISCSLAILNLPRWKCPSDGDLYAMGHFNRTEEWSVRMRELQGAVIAASAFQVIIGYFGLVGFVLRFITPLTIAPTISLVGISLVNHGIEMSSGNWYISATTIFLVTIFSQYLRNFYVKIPVYSLSKGWHLIKIKAFQLFPVIMATIIIYIVCALLTNYRVLDEGDPGRTDGYLTILENTEWFRIPYPFQWGWPTFTVSSILAMLAAVVTGIIESVGDYYACARICGQANPPKKAVNRGVGIEGFCCILAGTMGIGTGVTSFSENIGAIGVTRVASRKVVQCGAIIMILLSCFGKVGAAFATIPTPIIGGLLCILFAVVTAVGLSNLQHINMESHRNLFILGTSIFLGIGLPEWIRKNPDSIRTGILPIDQLFTVLLSTHMFVGGFLGFFLDNTIPGTIDERGILARKESILLTEVEPLKSPNIYKPPKIKFGHLAKIREELTSLLRRSK